MEHTAEQVTAGLSPKKAWKHFYEISRIPRESGNEDGVRSYVKSFAEKRNLEYAVDSTGNIIIKKPASPGREQDPGIILQGHMDMVCVKTPDSVHNFDTDPISLKVDGDWMKADGTSLGADNGIAVAMVLALLEENIEHGPLEALFTVSEETGLDGAFGLDISLLEGRRLINLDSEEEGVFYIGSAGGGEIIAEAVSEWEPVEAVQAASDERQLLQAWEITFTNFSGGHSGGEIHQGRANAVKETIRFLKGLSRTVPVRIAALNGGTKRNVIPSHCTAQFVMTLSPGQSQLDLYQEVEKHMRILKDEYSFTDPNAEIKLQAIPLPELVLNRRQSQELINALYITPHGIERMSNAVPGIVETSNNLAAVSVLQDKIWIDTSQRSSIESARIDMAQRTAAALEIFGAETREENVYPSWSPNPGSPLPKQLSEVYRKLFGTDPVITAIHAGLECGVINSKAPDMDSISFGPNLEEVHSTAERVQISSVDRMYRFLKAVVSELS